MLEQYEDVMTIADLREVLNIGSNAAYKLLNQGVISAFRIGRTWKIPKQAVIRFIDQGPQQGQSA